MAEGEAGVLLYPRHTREMVGSLSREMKTDFGGRPSGGGLSRGLVSGGWLDTHGGGVLSQPPARIPTATAVHPGKIPKDYFVEKVDGNRGKKPPAVSALEIPQQKTHSAWKVRTTSGTTHSGPQRS